MTDHINDGVQLSDPVRERAVAYFEDAQRLIENINRRVEQEELGATTERVEKRPRGLDTSARKMLTEALAPALIDITRFFPGTHKLDFLVQTPTILACDEKRFPRTPVVELCADSPPTRAAVLQAFRRDGHGLAHFAIGELGLLSPPVTLLLLRSERRVWCVTRPYLTSVTAELVSGGAVPGFTLRQDGLEFAIPRGSSPYSLTNAVLFDSLAR